MRCIDIGINIIKTILCIPHDDEYMSVPEPVEIIIGDTDNSNLFRTSIPDNNTSKWDNILSRFSSWSLPKDQKVMNMKKFDEFLQDEVSNIVYEEPAYEKLLQDEDSINYNTDYSIQDRITNNKNDSIRNRIK